MGTPPQRPKRFSDKEISRGDKIRSLDFRFDHLDTLLDYSGFVPGAGPYIKTITGMMPDVVISSDASRVTKIRSRCSIADWVFEAKFDGFRPAADTVRGRLISRNGNRMKRFEGVLELLPKGHVFDGELVVLDDTDARSITSFCSDAADRLTWRSTC